MYALTCAIVALLMFHVYTLLSQRSSNEYRMHRLTHQSAEALVLVARLRGRQMFFQLDTGYAGAPVLSLSYLAVLGAQTGIFDLGKTAQQRYGETLTALQAASANTPAGAGLVTTS